MADPLQPRERDQDPVPLRALGLSILALSVPVIGALAAPDWMAEEAGMLLWLTVLIPPFLLTYYRGWRGASLGLAGGMAALALAQVLLVSLDLGVPDFRIIFWMIIAYVGVCVGIGLLAELLRRERAAAESMALSDPLTQLPNRRHASIFLDAAFATGVRGEPVSIVLLDLDHFKAVNDEHGHTAGDRVLQRFGEALERATRRMDLSCRWGGEEFLSILSNCKPADALIFVDRVRSEFEKESFPFGPVTFSAGIAGYSSGMTSSEELIDAADRALYEAKDAGRNRAAIAEAPPVEVELRSEEASRTSRGEAAPHSQIRVLVRPDQEPDLGFDPDDTELVLEMPGGDPLPGGDETILLVDDYAPARKGMGRLLRELGYHVVEAPDGRSALASARSLDSIGLVITDLVMPGMSGFTFMNRFQEEFGASRVLYVSGHAKSELAWEGAPGAEIRYLSKPMAPPDLACSVRDLLDRPLAGMTATSP